MTDKIRSSFLQRLHAINSGSSGLAIKESAEPQMIDYDPTDEELIEFVESMEPEDAIDYLIEQIEEVGVEELREQVRALLELSPGLLGRYASAARKQFREVRPKLAAARAAGHSDVTVKNKAGKDVSAKRNQSNRAWGNKTALNNIASGYKKGGKARPVYNKIEPKSGGAFGFVKK